MSNADAADQYNNDQEGGEPSSWRPLSRHNPNGVGAVAAATNVANAARERTAEHLLAAQLEQMHGQVAARAETMAAALWTGQLPELAVRPLDDDAIGAVIARVPS
ncbi:hypothetical protein [Streptomyces rimosus]|uniref:hypothetical protein n=1 Tax=Streptomyces rimosus TaxID=1927 RepID=UPI0037B1CDBF